MDLEGRVLSVNRSSIRGIAKTAVPRIELDARGIVGDAHAGPWHRQVSLLGQGDIDRFSRKLGRTVSPGEFAENLTIGDLDLAQAGVLDRIKSGTVELQVTQIGKSCHGTGCAIYQEAGQCAMPDHGIFARVVKGGCVQVGDTVTLHRRALELQVITLSDRASAGLYEDRSGPRVCELLEAHFAATRWHPHIQHHLLPDDAEALQACLARALQVPADVIFTLGSTGVGPRDIAPEIMEARCEKRLPGIVEFIRCKYGEAIPSARLSRSVAGTTGQTQLYALPGSVRAGQQYVEAILETLEHTIYMLHGLDVHE
jgi:molybdenum cofactor synthesis domain-containing protein